MSKFKTMLLLHVMLMIYSSGGIFSKLAGREEFLSWKFCLYYGVIIALLGLYAIGWQQIIKRMPLTTAFANKAVTVVWGLIWGIVCFRENLTIGKIIGVTLVVIGVVIFAKSEEDKEHVE